MHFNFTRSISNPEDTRILNITVTSADRVLAKDIANEVAKVAVSYLPETMSTDAPNIAQTAQLASAKSGPSYTRYTLMGALMGAFLCCAYVVLRYLADDTIHTADNLEEAFGIVPLAVIPGNDSLVANKKREEETDK